MNQDAQAEKAKKPKTHRARKLESETDPERQLLYAEYGKAAKRAIEHFGLDFFFAVAFLAPALQFAKRPLYRRLHGPWARCFLRDNWAAILRPEATPPKLTPDAVFYRNIRGAALEILKAAELAVESRNGDKLRAVASLLEACVTTGKHFADPLATYLLCFRSHENGRMWQESAPTAREVQEVLKGQGSGLWSMRAIRRRAAQLHIRLARGPAGRPRKAEK